MQCKRSDLNLMLLEAFRCKLLKALFYHRPSVSYSGEKEQQLAGIAANCIHGVFSFFLLTKQNYSVLFHAHAKYSTRILQSRQSRADTGLLFLLGFQCVNRHKLILFQPVTEKHLIAMMKKSEISNG